MSNIIEKLGIKPLKKYGLSYPSKIDHQFNEKSIRELEQQNNEMLERDIRYIQKLEDEIKQCDFCGMNKAVEGLRMALDYFDFTPDEKAINLSWSEIKELSNE